jgi:hypothetical protein
VCVVYCFQNERDVKYVTTELPSNYKCVVMFNTLHGSSRTKYILRLELRLVLVDAVTFYAWDVRFLYLLNPPQPYRSPDLKGAINLVQL